MSQIGVATLLLVSAFGCGTQQSGAGEGVSDKNLVTGGGKVDRPIGDANNEFRIVDSATLRKRIADGSIKAPTSAAAVRYLGARASARLEKAPMPRRKAAPADAVDDTLVAGFPVDLIGERNVFGGVITKVSDHKTESLGMLKLTDLPALNVRTILAKTEGGYALFLVGCARDCVEGAEETPLIGFPVVGVDEKGAQVILDLSAVGAELDIMGIVDPSGIFTGLKTESAKTVAFDYSLSTLVFDVESTMQPLLSFVPVEDADKVKVTARWYLRLNSVFDTSFVNRPAIEGVGFFMTDRAKTPRVTRWARPAPIAGTKTPVGVRYYIKDVPTEYRPAFQKAFDSWNVEFNKVIGRPIFAYEFVEKDDARYPLLVPGDVRYNIVEWDLVNKAPYGGLGPSIANQQTGELFSANTLIQGPTIVELYKAWFASAGKITTLAKTDKRAAAVAHQQLVKKLRAKLVATKVDGKVTARLAQTGLPLRVTGQMPEYRDPLMARNTFELPPEGLEYLPYMQGYFQEMVAHELGHNLGLRHNFRGNLNGTDDLAEGGVSSSIMEYLGKSFRHLNRIGVYDVMAIGYGYAGKTPTRTDMFCTDENVADVTEPSNSAECSRGDATRDPFSFFAARLEKAVDFATGRGSDKAPVWTPVELEGEIETDTLGLALYAASAEATAGKWTNFFGVEGRPANAEGVYDYVKTVLLTKLCGERVEASLLEKSSDEARAKATENVGKVRAQVRELLHDAGIVPEDEMVCGG